MSNVAVMNDPNGGSAPLICSYLLYSGRLNNAEDAISYYSAKSGKVVKPSHQCYVHYFESVLTTPNITPVPKYLASINLSCVPNMKNGTCRPYVEIYNSHDLVLLYTDKCNVNNNYY